MLYPTHVLLDRYLNQIRILNLPDRLKYNHVYELQYKIFTFTFFSRQS